MPGDPKWVKVNKSQAGIYCHSALCAHRPDFFLNPFKIGLNFPGVECTSHQKYTEGSPNGKLSNQQGCNGISGEINDSAGQAAQYNSWYFTHSSPLLIQIHQHPFRGIGSVGCEYKIWIECPNGIAQGKIGTQPVHKRRLSHRL